MKITSAFDINQDAWIVRIKLPISMIPRKNGDATVKIVVEVIERLVERTVAAMKEIKMAADSSLDEVQ